MWPQLNFHFRTWINQLLSLWIQTEFPWLNWIGIQHAFLTCCGTYTIMLTPSCFFSAIYCYLTVGRWWMNFATKLHAPQTNRAKLFRSSSPSSPSYAPSPLYIYSHTLSHGSKRNHFQCKRSESNNIHYIEKLRNGFWSRSAILNVAPLYVPCKNSHSQSKTPQIALQRISNWSAFVHLFNSVGKNIPFKKILPVFSCFSRWLYPSTKTGSFIIATLVLKLSCFTIWHNHPRF